MYRLESLTLKNFRSFVGEHRLDFPERGLMQLRGPSGAGKTSIILGLLEAFGVCPLPRRELQSWYTEEPPEVRLGLRVGDRSYTVVRGNQVQLLGGEAPVKGATAVQQALERLLGLPADLLVSLTYRPQDEPGMFLRRPDSEKKDFLTKILGLSGIEAAVEAGQEKVRALEARVQAAEGEVQALRGILDADQGPANVTPPQLRDTAEAQGRVRDARVCIDTFQAGVTEQEALVRGLETQEALALREADTEAADALSPLEAQRRQLQKDGPVPAPLASDDTEARLATAESDLRGVRTQEDQRRAAFDATRRQLESELRGMEVRLGGMGGFQKQAQRLQQARGPLLEQRCQTCGQAWQKAQEELRRIDAELQVLQASITAAEADRPLAEALRGQLASIVFRPSPDLATAEARLQAAQQARAQSLAEARARNQVIVEAHRAQVADLGARIETLRSQAAARRAAIQQVYRQRPERADLVAAQKALVLSQQALALAQRDLQAVEDLNAAEERRHAGEAQRLAELQAQLQAAEQRRDAIRAEAGVELDFAAMLGREGFLGVIFSEVLAEISSEVNTNLVRIPNVDRVHLEFRTEVLQQKGTVKKAITPVLRVGGHETSLRGGASGGMRSSIDLLVDLAVAAVGSRRTGSFPGWLLLDEPFNGLGVQDKELVVEVLRAYAQDRLVILIDHATEVREGIVKAVDIRFENGYSNLGG